jgi:hypothetical protein
MAKVKVIKMDKSMVMERIQNQICPYCGADRIDLSYDNVEIDGQEAHQTVDCMVCEKHFTEVYVFRGVILSNHPRGDFRIDIDDYKRNDEPQDHGTE